VLCVLITGEKKKKKRNVRASTARNTAAVKQLQIDWEIKFRRPFRLTLLQSNSQILKSKSTTRRTRPKVSILQKIDAEMARTATAALLLLDFDTGNLQKHRQCSVTKSVPSCEQKMSKKVIKRKTNSGKCVGGIWSNMIECGDFFENCVKGNSRILEEKLVVTEDVMLFFISASCQKEESSGGQVTDKTFLQKQVSVLRRVLLFYVYCSFELKAWATVESIGRFHFRCFVL